MTRVLKAKIAVNKIDKNKIVPRTFKDKQGNDVTIQEYAFDVVIHDEPQHIKDISETKKMVKSGFISESITKEELDGGKKGTILGDAIEFQEKEEPTKSALADETEKFPSEDLNFADIPF